MIVYVVTSGTGSTYKVEGVFEERKQAAYYCAVNCNEEIRITECDTEAITFGGKKPLLTCWCARVDEDNELCYLEEEYTFREEDSVVWSEGGWNIRMTTVYGVSANQMRKTILEKAAELNG